MKFRETKNNATEEENPTKHKAFFVVEIIAILNEILQRETEHINNFL